MFRRSVVGCQRYDLICRCEVDGQVAVRGYERGPNDIPDLRARCRDVHRERCRGCLRDRQGRKRCGLVGTPRRGSAGGGLAAPARRARLTHRLTGDHPADVLTCRCQGLRADVRVIDQASPYPSGMHELADDDGLSTSQLFALAWALGLTAVIAWLVLMSRLEGSDSWNRGTGFALAVAVTCSVFSACCSVIIAIKSSEARLRRSDLRGLNDQQR
jgi:hypothetical protein